MRIVQITVGDKKTVSLPEYNNVAPAFSVTADINPDESVLDAIKNLSELVDDHLRERVDTLLEEAGQSPCYTGDELSELWRFRQADALVIVPEGFDPPSWGNWSRVPLQAMRHEALRRHALKRGKQLFFSFLQATEWYSAREPWYLTAILMAYDDQDYAQGLKRRALLLYRPGLNMPRRVPYLEQGNEVWSDLGKVEHQAGEIDRQTVDLKWISATFVANTQDELRTILDNWAKTHNFEQVEWPAEWQAEPDMEEIF